MASEGKPQLTVRDARPEELDEVAAVILDSYRQYQKVMPPDSWEWYAANMVDVRSRLPISELIVAEFDGRIVGTVTFYPDGHRSGEGTWPEGWAGIRLVGVHPDVRGHGIAKALMQECLDRCRARGVVTLGLHTTEHMRVAKDMYERMGFVRINAHDGSTTMAYRLDL